MARLVCVPAPSSQVSDRMAYVLKMEKDLDMPSTFYFVDVKSRPRCSASSVFFFLPRVSCSAERLFRSLLDPFEYKDYEVEKKFFEDNPNLGTMEHWPLIGDLVNPLVRCCLVF